MVSSLSPFQSQMGLSKAVFIVHAPALFSMLFSVMLTDVFRNENVGIEFRSRTDGGFYKPQRLRTQSKVMLDINDHLLIKDFCSISSATFRLRMTVCIMYVLVRVLQRYRH